MVCPEETCALGDSLWPLWHITDSSAASFFSSCLAQFSHLGCWWPKTFHASAALFECRAGRRWSPRSGPRPRSKRGSDQTCSWRPKCHWLWGRRRRTEPRPLRWNFREHLVGAWECTDHHTSSKVSVRSRYWKQYLPSQQSCSWYLGPLVVPEGVEDPKTLFDHTMNTEAAPLASLANKHAPCIPQNQDLVERLWCSVANGGHNHSSIQSIYLQGEAPRMIANLTKRTRPARVYWDITSANIKLCCYSWGPWGLHKAIKNSLRDDRSLQATLEEHGRLSAAPPLVPA